MSGSADGPPTLVRERAFAKVNLVLHVGPPQSGGLHPLCSLFASIDLADELEVRRLDAGADDAVVCPDVEGENLALRAVRVLRERCDGQVPRVEVRIDKRIPVAAGLGGGSADAAATLRAANRIAGEPLDAAALRGVGAELGSDVPSQIEPGHAVVSGTGEVVEPIELPAAAVVLVPQSQGLSTAEVYAELDRRRGWREGLDAGALRSLAGSPLERVAQAVENDLEPAAAALRPGLGAVVAGLRDAGALAAAVSGSGPTCFALFAGEDEARRAAQRIDRARVTFLRAG